MASHTPAAWNLDTSRINRDTNNWAGRFKDLDKVAAEHGRTISSSLGEVRPGDRRPVVLLDKEIDLPKAARAAIQASMSRGRG